MNPSCDHDTISKLAADGDSRALAKIAECYLDRLLGVGRCACGDHDRAEDAVQEALLIAAERLDQFRGEGTALAWLSRIVVNACRCNQRGRKNDPRWNQPLSVAEQTPSAHETPYDRAIRSELGEALTCALEGLDPMNRELFIATQIDGRSSLEVAAQLGVTPQAARARLTRIRRQLRERLKAWSPLDPSSGLGDSSSTERGGQSRCQGA